MLALTLLLLLPTAPARAIDPPNPALPLGASPTYEDLDRVEKEFWNRADKFDKSLPGVRDRRAAILTSADPEARFAEADALVNALNAEAWEVSMLGGHGRKLLQFLVARIGARSLSAATRRQEVRDPGLARLAVYEHAMQAMVSKGEAMRMATDKEMSQLSMIRAELDRRATARQRGRLMAGAAAGALAMAALGTVLGRRRPAAPPPPSGVSRIVAQNFEVTRVIGRGSMGEVLEAVDTTLKRRVALKRLRPELLREPAELEKLLKEARVMAALKHPNVVAIHSIERDAGQVYLALELVEGGTLEERLRKDGRLPWPEATRVFAGAATGVDYAHAQGVVHRDLKPSNIMLADDGEVKVMDFGIAHQAAKTVSRLTRSASWGTPAYMAPEAELGEVSPAGDVYALAVCLYETLTGEVPFKGPDFLTQKREGLYVPASRLAAGLPEGVDAMLARALSADPGRRYPTAGALAAACRGLG